MSGQLNGKLTLTGFADEIAEPLDEQLAVLEELGLTHLDLRQVDGRTIHEFSDAELADIKQTLDERGFQVSSIGSPIGKIHITDPFGPHLEKFERVVEVAEHFDTEYIRLFSYYIPEEDDPSEHREEVLERMARKTEIAEQAGVKLIHENEKRIYGDVPSRCRDILTNVDSPALTAAFDPANFLEVGVRPYPDALINHVEHVGYLHIKDAIFGEEGEIRPAGEGDGRIKDIVTAMDGRGFTGFASLEPHLLFAGKKEGFSGPEGFRMATEAFVDILEEAGIAYE